jgi:autotransporter-associated beta strand protein
MLVRTYFRRWSIAAIAMAGLFASTQALAIDVTLNAGDALGTSSYNTAGGWSNAAAPSAGNNYIVSTKWLRSPEATGVYTFGGDALRLQTGGAILSKNIGVQTLNQNLILDGGYVRSGAGAADILTLGGTINITGNSGGLIPDQSPFVINSAISGSGTLFVGNSDILNNFGGGSGPGRGIDFAGASTMTGNVVANALDMVWTNTSSWQFNIGSSGVNNNIAGTGVATFDGMFNFNLSGASSAPGDSWTITNVATTTYGTNFSVGGGFARSGSVWTNGTYTFNPSTGILAVVPPPVEWNTDLDNQLFSVGANWTGGVAPGNNGDALFGGVITGNRTVLLDTNKQLNSLSVTNAGDGDYFLAPQSNQVLTLVNEAKVETIGRHWLRVQVAGTSGLNAVGTGELVLDADNNFTGGLSINDTNLAIVHSDAIPAGNNITVANNAQLRFWGPTNAFFTGQGSTGYVNGTINGSVSVDATSLVEVNDSAQVTFSGEISGAGGIAVNTAAQATLTAANTYSGVTTINSGRLTVTNATALGAGDGTAATQTTIAGNANTGTLALSGNIAVSGELINMGAREGAAVDSVQLTSSGNNSISGNIYGNVGGNRYTIESTSGTLTLSGTITTPDSSDRDVVFTGAGNFSVAKISDGIRNDQGVVTQAGIDNTISVIKRGSGTLTITTASSDPVDYWNNRTVIEGGTLAVLSDGNSGGELATSAIAVQSGATFNVSNFGQYTVQNDQSLSGGGAINTGANNIRIFAGNNNQVTPGDNGVGTLSVSGNVVMSNLGTGGTLNYQLGDQNTVGGSENDLIAVSGTLTTPTGSPSATLNVTPVSADLAGNTAYRLMTHTSGSAPDVSGISTIRVLDNLGNVMNTRQTFSVSSTTTQVNLDVSGNEAAITWNGAGATDAWNKSSTNWSVGATSFRDLDDVTFGAGGAKTVTVNEVVSPGSVTFNSNSTYTFTGTGGISGYGAVNVNSGTVKMQNTGNNYAGTTTVASGARLEVGSATTGDVVVNGTLSVGAAGLTQVVAPINFTYQDGTWGAGGNTTLSDGSTLTPTASPFWMERTVFGNSGQVLQAQNDVPTDAPELRSTISGLTPGQQYTVHLNFWDADLNGGGLWRVQAGSAPGTLTLFAAPNEVAGATNGVALASLTYVGTAPMNAEGNRQMWAANLGQLTADGSGQIHVYFDDTGTANGDDRTWFDGLSYTNQSGATGAVTGAEVLNVAGDLTLSSTGKMLLDIGQSGYNDRIAITGDLVADGILEVVWDADAPALAIGSNFNLFDFAAATGTFDTLTLPTLAGGMAWNTDNLLTDGTLSVIAAGLLGDFNNDGIVNLADYTVWRDNLGAPDSVLPGGSTDDGSGLVDAGDYATWKANFGNTSTPLAGLEAGQTNVPEPATVVILLSAIGAAGFVARRRCM